jgi:hypothetical protein
MQGVEGMWRREKDVQFDLVLLMEVGDERSPHSLAE